MRPAALAVVAASLAAACANSDSAGAGHRCGHVYVADPVVFYGGFYYGYGYDPYYDPYYPGDPGYWSYDDTYSDDPSSDPGYGDPGSSDPGYSDPGTGDNSSPLHTANVVTTKGVGTADANGCYACVLECTVTKSTGPAREIANGVSAYGDDRACGWARKAMDSWASTNGATVGTCVRLDPRRTPAGAAPTTNDAGVESTDAAGSDAHD